jgi:hypothetical protein
MERDASKILAGTAPTLIYSVPNNDTYIEHSYVGFEIFIVVIMKEFYLLGYNAVQPAESQPTFRRNMSPPSSGSNKSSEKPASSACHLFSSWFLARLILQS